MIDRKMQARQQYGYLSKIIAEIRNDHPTLSCRAMYYKILPEKLGRDAFEQLCKELGYQTAKSVNKRRTTDSSGVIRFANLLEGLTLVKPDQAWASDITYFEVGSRYYYITFVMDCYSRLILGYSVSQRLVTEQTTLAALKMAIATRGGKVQKDIIIHSDGGGQYYDKDFLKFTQLHQMRNSMCEYAYENGKAERLNGTIKNNYLIHFDIKCYADLIKGVDRVIPLYNKERPHKSLNYVSPLMFENKFLTLQQQTMPTMTESFDAKSCF